MKYGLLYYKNTDNIGDDIQSYAASRFLPKIDYLVDRENLELFMPNKKEAVKVIMNAWYIHDKYNFDISPYIEPLYISMFFKKFTYEAGITIKDEYLNGNVILSLKKYSPVGTRDIHTKKILDKFGIDSYFSGCMTLTINKLDDVKKGDYIVAVGLTKEEVDYIKKNTKRKVIVFKQDVKAGSFKDETWNQRKYRVEQTLRLYQGAHMVVTTKLHCALPCLALETPVLMVYDNIDAAFKEIKDRIGTYLKYLNHIPRDEYLNSNIDFDNPLENPKGYLELRKALICTCSNFINRKSVISTSNLPNLDDYRANVIKSRNMRKLPIEQLEKLQKIYEKECEKASSMYDELNELRYKYGKLQEQYELLDYQYKRIVNSKPYKVARKIKRAIIRSK